MYNYLTHRIFAIILKPSGSGGAQVHLVLGIFLFRTLSQGTMSKELPFQNDSSF